MSTAAAPVDARGRWFVNFPVDFLLIGGGSILFFAILPLFQDGTRSMAVVQAALWLTWIANWPHFAATNYRLYGCAEHVRQYPITAIAIPILVLVGMGAALVYPTEAAPYFIKLFMLWSPYHYCGQTLGISLLYARRGGHRPHRYERFFLAAFIYGTFLMRALLSESSVRGQVYYGVEIPGLGVPRELSIGFTWWMYACAIVFVGMLVHRYWRDRVLPPFMYLLPAISQYVWFIVAGAKPGYAEFVLFLHGLQYLVIAWALHIKEQANARSSATTAPAIVNDSVRWWLTIAAGGAVLFYVLPHALTQFGVTLGLASAVILAGIQIHHFFVDGVIWKLKSRSVVSPLLVNVPALVERRAPFLADAEMAS